MKGYRFYALRTSHQRPVSTCFHLAKFVRTRGEAEPGQEPAFPILFISVCMLSDAVVAAVAIRHRQAARVERH